MENKRVCTVYVVIQWITLAVVVMTISVIGIKCLNIYSGGSGEYTREAVSLAFAEISPLVYICVLTIISGFVLSFFVLPKKQRPAVSDTYKLLAYKNKYLLDNEQVDKEEKKRKILKTILLVCATVAFVIPLFYFLDKKNFSVENLNSDIAVAAVAVLIPCVVIFVLAAVCSALCSKSEKKELAIYKASVSNGEAKKVNKVIEDRKAVLYVRLALMCIAVILIILGVFNDGIGDVYGKAVRICTECIGLG